MSAEDRVELLHEAERYITKDRNTSYGEPEDNFGHIAEIWNAQLSHKLKEPLTRTEVALLMVGMKLARLKTNPTHRDSFADGVGYLACGWDVAKQVLAREAEAAHGIACVAPVGTDPSNAGAFRPLGYITSDGITELAKPSNGPGKLGPHWCGNKNDHEPHRYGSGSRAFDSLHGAQWCDGFLNEHKAHQEANLRVIKGVADKAKSGPRMATEPGA